MLKGLTQLKVAEECVRYLEEQKETLKYCMSLPQVLIAMCLSDDKRNLKQFLHKLFSSLFQVQIILYETHSVTAEENFGMVNSVIEFVNEMAKQKHEEEHRLALEREEG